MATDRQIMKLFNILFYLAIIYKLPKRYFFLSDFKCEILKTMIKHYSTVPFGGHIYRHVCTLKLINVISADRSLTSEITLKLLLFCAL